MDTSLNGDENRNESAATKLQSSLRHADDGEIAAHIRPLFLDADLIALGDTEDVEPESGESRITKILHVRADSSVLVPVFTSAVTLNTALRRRKEWANLVLFEIRGAELLSGLDPDLVVVIDPGSPSQFYLDVSDERFQ